MPGPFVQHGPQPRALAVRPRETWERERSLETNTRSAKRMECTWWTKSLASVAWADLGCSDLNRWKSRRGNPEFVWRGRRGSKLWRKQLLRLPVLPVQEAVALKLGQKPELVLKPESFLRWWNPFFFFFLHSLLKKTPKTCFSGGRLSISNGCRGNKWLYFVTKFTYLAHSSYN